MVAPAHLHRCVLHEHDGGLTTGSGWWTPRRGCINLSYVGDQRVELVRAVDGTNSSGLLPEFVECIFVNVVNPADSRTIGAVSGS